MYIFKLRRWYGSRGFHDFGAVREKRWKGSDRSDESDLVRLSGTVGHLHKKTGGIFAPAGEFLNPEKPDQPCCFSYTFCMVFRDLGFMLRALPALPKASIFDFTML